MLDQIIQTEQLYYNLFCQSRDEQGLTSFYDDQIIDMYTHNFTLVRHRSSDFAAIIEQQLQLHQQQGKDFFRAEFNFELDKELRNELNALIIQPEITVYDYMHIKTGQHKSISGNQDAVVQQALSGEIIADGIKVDILANETAMGCDFARRRIARKSKVYQDVKAPLDLYVCYYDGQAIGNCELMIQQPFAKIEDFDILPHFQRKGFGSSVIKHLLQAAEQRQVSDAYLITDSSDTAKQMYTKCGFKKVGVKTELLFHLK